MSIQRWSPEWPLLWRRRSSSNHAVLAVTSDTLFPPMICKTPDRSSAPNTNIGTLFHISETLGLHRLGPYPQTSSAWPCTRRFPLHVPCYSCTTSVFDYTTLTRIGSNVPHSNPEICELGIWCHHAAEPRVVHNFSGWLRVHTFCGIKLAAP